MIHVGFGIIAWEQRSEQLLLSESCADDNVRTEEGY